VAQLLLQRDATVTICHSKDARPALSHAAGRHFNRGHRSRGLVGRDHIKPGATVIDVGMNKVTDQATARALFGSEAEQRLQVLAKRGYTLVGDVHPAEPTRSPGAARLYRAVSVC